MRGERQRIALGIDGRSEHPHIGFAEHQSRRHPNYLATPVRDDRSNAPAAAVPSQERASTQLHRPSRWRKTREQMPPR
jgi:hypothetical protein